MQKQRTQAERAFHGTMRLMRAAQSVVWADALPDEPSNKPRKRVRALIALGIIQELLDQGYTEPDIYNWQALTLKRLDNIQGAIESAQNVSKLG